MTTIDAAAATAASTESAANLETDPRLHSGGPGGSLPQRAAPLPPRRSPVTGDATAAVLRPVGLLEATAEGGVDADEGVSVEGAQTGTLGALMRAGATDAAGALARARRHDFAPDEDADATLGASSSAAEAGVVRSSD